MLTQKRIDGFAREVASEKRDGAQALVKTLIVMLVDALAFIFHWVIARKARASAA